MDGPSGALSRQFVGWSWIVRHPHKAVHLASNWLHGLARKAPAPATFQPAMEWRPSAPKADGWVVLLAGDSLPLHDDQRATTGSPLRLRTLIDLLGSQGWPMVFASRLAGPELPGELADETPRLRCETALRAAGVSRFAYGVDEAGAMMAALGPSLRYAFLSSTQVAHDFIPCVRSHCPTATIVYDRGDVRAAGAAPEAAPGRDAGLSVGAPPINAMEMAAVRAADIVIVRSNEEKSALLDLVPTAVVEVLPDLSAAKALDLFHV